MITPLWWREGTVSYVDTFGLPLGAAADTSYAQRIISLQPGHMLLLVSDGIVEAMNSRKEMWGFARLEAALTTLGGLPPQDVVDSILAHVHAFTADAPAHDDMTVVALQVLD
jgi:sigma-B regulation protein RsbU (phosphoserine phosphatase)